MALDKQTIAFYNKKASDIYVTGPARFLHLLQISYCHNLLWAYKLIQVPTIFDFFPLGARGGINPLGGRHHPHLKQSKICKSSQKSCLSAIF